MSADDIIKQLKLEPHDAEGGYFNELYRSKEKNAAGDRCIGTSIYYLMKPGNQSRWHKVKSDEIWLYHCGTPAIQLLLFPDGSWEERVIGGNIENGQRPQSIIPAETWQAAVLADNSPECWGLFGAVVFPGFEFADFELGDGKILAKQYPEAADKITQYNLL